MEKTVLCPVSCASQIPLSSLPKTETQNCLILNSEKSNAKVAPPTPTSTSHGGLGSFLSSE